MGCSVRMFYNPAFLGLTQGIKDYIAAGVSMKEKVV